MNCGAQGKGPSLAHCCMMPNKYYHKLALEVWSPCRNLRWVMCAAQGYLPGQRRHRKGGGYITFPTSDRNQLVHNQFTVETWQTAAFVGVTVHEFCLLDRVCSNADELWTLNSHDTWTCDFDARSLYRGTASTAASPLVLTQAMCRGTGSPALFSDHGDLFKALWQ